MTSIPEAGSGVSMPPADTCEIASSNPDSLWHRLASKLSRKRGMLLVMGNSAALGIEKIVKLVVALLITANLGRMLGPVEFGIYSTISAVITALAVTADLGTSRVIVRELVRDSSPPELVLGTAFVIRLLGSLLVGAIGFVASVFAVSSSGPTVYIIAAGFVIGWLLRAFDVVDCGFQGKLHCGYPVAVRSIVMIAMAGVQFWMIHTHCPLWSFSISFVAESFLASMALLAVWKRCGVAPLHNWVLSRRLMRRYLSESWPMFAAAFLSTIYYKSDLLIVNRMCSAEEAGLYASASRLYDMMISPIPMFAVATFPVLARWYDDTSVPFRKRYVTLTRSVTVVWIVILGFFTLFSQQVLRLFYGPSFVGASHIFAVNCLSALLMANGSFRSSYLNLASRQHVLLWTSLISAAVNVSLNYVLVREYGAIGAAYGGVITQAISLIFLNLLWPDTRWLTLAHLGIASPEPDSTTLRREEIEQTPRR